MLVVALYCKKGAQYVVIPCVIIIIIMCDYYYVDRSSRFSYLYHV